MPCHLLHIEVRGQLCGVFSFQELTLSGLCAFPAKRSCQPALERVHCQMSSYRVRTQTGRGVYAVSDVPVFSLNLECFHRFLSVL